MSAAQTLVLTVLPNGIASDGALALSVLVTPRLSGAATLADFPDMLNWTDLVRRRGLTLTLATATATHEAAVATAGLRPDLWKEVFKPASPVDSYPRPDFDKRLVVSYPHRVAHAFLREAYQSLAISPGSERGRLSSLLSDLSFRNGTTSTLDAAISAQRIAMWEAQSGEGGDTGSRVIIQSPQPAEVLLPPPTRTMAERFELFHHLPPAPNRPPLPSTPAEFSMLVDFHKALSALSAYPSLMRALGLVFDLEVPGDLVAASPGAASAYGWLAVAQVTPGWTWSVAPRIAAPQTSVARDDHVFRAAPAASPASAAAGAFEPADVDQGFLAMDGGDFELVNVELDGAMLKALSLADNVALAGDEGIEQVLPALRSGGLSLVADNRAQEVLRAIADNTAFQQAEDGGDAYPRPLNARDVTRGYRLDVWASSDGRWRSLHRRDGVYRFGPDGAVVYTTQDEEGFTQLGVAQAAADPTREPDQASIDAGAPQPDTDLYVHERIARWRGWSLSAPRPGLPLNRSADPAQAAEPDPTADQAPTAFKMRASFSVHAGSLPRLRFGVRYRFRVRAVDLAGNSPPLTAPSPAPYVLPEGAPAAYFRFEPVAPPVVIPRATPVDGATLLHLVIRSRNTAQALDYTACGVTDERHLVPPKTDVLSVEHHGLFDDAQGRMEAGKATFDLIVTRDKGQFPVVDKLPLETLAQAATPWFPDPIARGVALAGLPWTPTDTTGRVQGGVLVYDVSPDVEPRPGSVTRIGFDGAWPDRQPFRLVLAEGRTPPKWDAAARTLTVFLHKAGEIEIPVSCYLNPLDLELMGVWDWMRAWFEAAEAEAAQIGGESVVDVAERRSALTRLTLDGGHQMITPSQVLTLTHAVQQPIGRPAWSLLPIVHDPAQPQAASALRNGFSPITAWRSPGSHHAVLLGALKIHGASTAKVDILARWTEWEDDLSKPRPTTHPAADHVETIELRSLDAAMLAADGLNTRYVATYIPQVDTLWFAAPFDALQGVESPFQLAAPLHQFGDTKHRRVRYHAVSTSRFQEFFPEPGLGFTRQSDDLLVSAPNSARPAAPDILYCVPLFGWERQETTNVKTEIRQGAGLRVYMNRPWYSSGEGELLAAVLWPQGAGALPTDADRSVYKSLFSQWGLDPIWATGALAPIPATWSFPLAATMGQGLTLEATPLLVDAAGHLAQYDAERELWFSDIVLEPGDVYAPFVRLALARYQPASIAGAELSHVVLADFAQLAPDRSAALTVDPADPTRGRLFVGGLGPAGPTTNLIVVTVEARDPSISGDLGWTPAAYAQGRAMEEVPAPTAAASTLWQGLIVFAKPPPPGTFRIVIREFELFETRQEEPFGVIPVMGERLVYASIIPWDFQEPPARDGS